MIPKIIHYCWFGGNPIPEQNKKCIESWKKYCPDYEIKEWNENNFDINCCDYVREAYEAGKWAFVSDFVRIWALHEFGGIYMDTDVEVIKNLDTFLSHKAFTGFESNDFPFTAVVGCESGHNYVDGILELYKNRHFRISDGNYDLTTNTELITQYMKTKYGIQQNNTLQQFADGLTVYPNDYFCPKSYIDNKVYLTSNTYTIHWFNASWHNQETKDYHRLYNKYSKIFGQKITDTFLGIYFSAKKEGFTHYIKKRIKPTK